MKPSSSRVVVPDHSTIVNQKVLWFVDGLVREGHDVLVILHGDIVATVEKQAGTRDPSGIVALQHLNALHERACAGGITLHVRQPAGCPHDVSMERSTRLLAAEHDGTLLTCEPVQEQVATIEGIAVTLLDGHQATSIDALLGKYFDDQTMSAHLVEGLVPRAKKGKPGDWNLVDTGDQPSTRGELATLVNEIASLVAARGEHGFLEIDYAGAKVFQAGPYRIAIAYPPVSKTYEITVARPLVHLSLSAYDLPRDLVDRFLETADGILVSGPPGAGKSTFASALANFYASHHKIVKTMESVRDLQVDPGITQYRAIEGEMEKNADLLLLVRPDYTIFDEVRRTRDFEIFVDLRQAGVGMVGVVHASSPIDAIQRFIARIDLGLLPQIVDTVVFVNGGAVVEVLGVRMVVKIPRGFRDEGLARPVVEVFSQLDRHRVLYELYTFGENVVVSPVEPSGGERRARKGSRDWQRSRDDGWHGGARDDGDEGFAVVDGMTPIEAVRFSKTHVIFHVGRKAASRVVSIQAASGYAVLTGTVSTTGELHVKRKSRLGRQLEAMDREDRAFTYTLL